MSESTVKVTLDIKDCPSELAEQLTGIMAQILDMLRDATLVNSQLGEIVLTDNLASKVAEIATEWGIDDIADTHLSSYTWGF